MAGPVITKLNSSNFHNWSSDLKYILLEKNLWNIVNKSEIAPQKDEKGLNLKETEAYKVRANQALSIIYLNVENEFKRLIEDCNDPITDWEKLRVNSCPDSRYHMHLFTNLIECKINTNESISLFSTRMLRIFNDIKEIDVKFSESYASFQILRYLPWKYDGIVQSILRWKKQEFKFPKIIEELSAEEVRLRLRDADSQKYHPQANQVKYKSNHGKDIQCWNCKEYGHMRNQCKKDSSLGFKSGGHPFRDNSASRQKRPMTSSKWTSASRRKECSD